jgi:hypothetical protein
MAQNEGTRGSNGPISHSSKDDPALEVSYGQDVAHPKLSGATFDTFGIMAGGTSYERKSIHIQESIDDMKSPRGRGAK